jgi:hypothetical protein
MTDILKAILKINPKAQVSVNADDINQITWHNGTTPISKEDIEAQFPIVELDMAMSNLRAKRNKLLSDTDYTQLPDVGFNAAERNNYMIYRQALRDITNNIETAEQAKSIVFPPKP